MAVLVDVLEEAHEETKQSWGFYIKQYVNFIKPHIIVTFALVSFTGEILAKRHVNNIGIIAFIKPVLATVLLSAAAESWTNLIDRKIDSVMPRTKKRAIPMGIISLENAIMLATVLTLAGFILASLLGTIAFTFFAFAFLDNVIIYSLLSKKMTPWSIVLGAPVGGLVLWGSYVALAKPITTLPLLLGLMVMFWVPTHIWLIATRYLDDYRKAGVPMAPVVWSKLSLSLAMVLSGSVMSTFAIVALAGIEPLSVGHLATIAIVILWSISIIILSALIPWHKHLSPMAIKLATSYLVLILIVSICFSL